MAETYGWTIDYIVDLSQPQIDALLDGKDQYEKLKQYFIDNDPDTSETKLNKQSGKNLKKGFDGLYELINIPGVNMTTKAKEKMSKILMNRAKQKG